jgi:hypothetical protein
MLDKSFPADNTPRNPISEIVKLLKDAPDAENVRVLIARHLAAGVNNRDSEEVFYWAVVHNGVAGGSVDPEVRLALMNALMISEDGSH